MAWASTTGIHEKALPVKPTDVAVGISLSASIELSNRTTLCAWHHLRAVHGGLARATGQAPDAIDWDLGLAADKAPLMRLRGDRYVHEQS